MRKDKGKVEQMHVPKKNRQLFMRVIELIDTFCDANLNDNYKELCGHMAGAICRTRLPQRSDSSAERAGAVANAVGWVNHLPDPNRKPHMTSAQLADGFGISQASMAEKSKAIRDKLDLMPLDPDWCLPELLKDNPLVWMLDVDGSMMDIRMAPRDVQEQAYDMGLIPFIPADKQEQEEAETAPEIEIIEVPPKHSKTSEPKHPQKLKEHETERFEDSEN
jgi:hypothetical protein